MPWRMNTIPARSTSDVDNRKGASLSRRRTVFRFLAVASCVAACLATSSAFAKQLFLSCYLTDAVDGSHPKNPPELPVFADTDAMKVTLFGAEPQNGVEISQNVIAFSRGDDLFSIDRNSGAIQIVSRSQPTNIVRGTCKAEVQKF
jgi:hypothetical protein